MRTAIQITVTLLVACFYGLESTAQTIIGKSYITAVPDIRAYHVDADHNKIGKDDYTFITKSIKFTVIDLTDSGAIIEFWNFGSGDTAIGGNPRQQQLDRLRTNQKSTEELMDKDSLKLSSLNAEILSIQGESQAKANKTVQVVELKARLDSLEKKRNELKTNVDKLEKEIEASKPGPENQYGDRIASKSDKFEYRNLGAYIDSRANGKHFLIDLEDLDGKCGPYNGNGNEFTWGAVTIPIKMRFGDGNNRYFSFEPAANLGLFAGYRRQIRGAKVQAINLLFGTSIGSVTLRTEDFFLSSGAERDTTGQYTGTALGLSASIGLVYQIESFQIGLFTGSDFLPSKVGTYWRHQGIPWFGVGIGFGLFSKDKSDGSAKNNN